MSVVPNAGDADTLATGGSAATLELLLVVVMLLDGAEVGVRDVDGSEVDGADVGAGPEPLMAGTETAVVDAAGADDTPAPDPVSWLDTVTVAVAPPADVHAEASTTNPSSADTITGRRTPGRRTPWTANIRPASPLRDIAGRLTHTPGTDSCR